MFHVHAALCSCPLCEPRSSLSGRPYGADDFLPMLTYVLAQCDLPQLDNEILYMMELLDPSLLQGEGSSFTYSQEDGSVSPGETLFW